MLGTVLLAAAAAVGIDAGWQPHPSGGLEYIIQIEPQMLESLKAGREVASDIPPQLGEVRSYRIKVGTESLPHDDPPPATDGDRGGEEQDREGETASPTSADRSSSLSLPSSVDHRPSTIGSLLSAPKPLAHEPDVKPLAEAAGFTENSVPEPIPQAPENHVTDSPDRETSQPWLPLTLALAALFAAVGGMLYLGWIAWDYRGRYRALLDRVIEAGGEKLPVADLPDSSGG